MDVNNKELKLITYKKYKEYDKKLLKKYQSKMSKKEYQYYTDKNNLFGFMGNCIYANEKENKILDSLWTKHLAKISKL